MFRNSIEIPKNLFDSIFIIIMFLMSFPKETRFDYFTPSSKPYGMSYGSWTVKWWQWLASIPTEVNPATDDTGKNAAENQKDPNVWFLAGTFGGKVAERKCTIPTHRSILFPVINYEMSPLEKPELKTEFELINHVVEDEDDIINIEATIDGQKIPVYRVRSDPQIFDLNITPKNLFGVSNGGVTRATSDGYWVFLKHLDPGKHEIYFAGSCSAGSRNVKVKYHIRTVQN